MNVFKVILIGILHFNITMFAQNLPLKGICAHRGASWSFPENTKIAIQEAIRVGAQMIEFDVRKTKDEKLIIIHNKSVDKTTDGTGDVGAMTLEDILKLDAGCWKDNKFKGEKIPELIDILEIVPDSIRMNIHIKDNEETAAAVANLLTERKQIDNVILAVERKSAEIVRSINGEIKICSMDRGNSPDDYLKTAIETNADFVQLTEREFSVLDQIIPILKKNNIQINYYYADSTDKMHLLFDAGVDFVLTNKVEQLLVDFNN